MGFPILRLAILGWVLLEPVLASEHAGHDHDDVVVIGQALIALVLPVALWRSSALMAMAAKAK